MRHVMDKVVWNPQGNEVRLTLRVKPREAVP